MTQLTTAWPEPLLSRIEDAGLNASAPPQQRWVDGWLVRTSPGKAKRARCIQPVADGRLSLDERLALVAEVFDAAGLPLIARLTPFSRPVGLDAVLEARGWRRLDDTRVMVAGLRALPDEPLPPGTRIEPLDPAAYAELIGDLRGSSAPQRLAHAERLLASPVPYQGWVLRSGDDATVLCCGQTARESDLVGLYDVFTPAASRGRGFARRLCGVLLAQAAATGARTGYLQVDADNTPARAAYRRLGFIDAYGYHYRTPDPDAD